MLNLLVGCSLLLFSVALPANAWQCDDARVSFEHHPSDYYGDGEYLSQCPDDETPIRCYHYHRHWICEKGDQYYWDRNLESAARAACGCTLPDGVAHRHRPSRKIRKAASTVSRHRDLPRKHSST